MIIWPILALTFAAGGSLASWKKRTMLEHAAKPAVLLCLFVWLYLTTGLQGLTLWFGAGILLSLAGNLLLMISPDRLFDFRWTASLLAYIAYLAGFQNELMEVTAWSVMLIVLLSINGARLMRRIVSAIRAGGQAGWVNPVIVYSVVVTVMLYAAMTTISNPEWTTRAAFLVSAGAFLLFVSDLSLAWNRFVSPIKNERIINSAAYHLGQVGLIAGVISQFG